MYGIFSRAARTRRSRLLIQMLLDETQAGAAEGPAPRAADRTSNADASRHAANLRNEIRGFRIVGLSDENETTV